MWNLTQDCAESHTGLCGISQRTVQNLTQNCAESHTGLCGISHRTARNLTQDCADSHTGLCRISRVTVRNLTQAIFLWSRSVVVPSNCMRKFIDWLNWQTSEVINLHVIRLLSVTGLQEHPSAWEGGSSAGLESELIFCTTASASST